MYNTNMDKNQIQDQENKPRNIIETAQMISKKSDEFWLKFLKWFWIFAIIYLVYLAIEYVFNKIGL